MSFARFLWIILNKFKLPCLNKIELKLKIEIDKGTYSV